MIDAASARASRLIRYLPNVVTIGRVLLVAPAGWLLWHDAVLQAMVLIAIAGISDAIDGELARRFDWRTRFGAIADPAADKLLVVVVFAVLTLKGNLPVWLLAAVVLRDVVIISGALAYRRLFGHLDIAPTALSKANTTAQIVMLVLVLIHLTGIEPFARFAAFVDPAGFIAVVAIGALSGGQYVVVWSRRARAEYLAQQATAAPRKTP